MRFTDMTAGQMQRAPRNAVYVWTDHHLNYPRQLAARLGREDLQIVSPSWLTQEKWIGQELSGIVTDHAIHLDKPQIQSLVAARQKIRLLQETSR